MPLKLLLLAPIALLLLVAAFLRDWPSAVARTIGQEVKAVFEALELDGAGNFKRYQVKYFHDAQPRLEGQGAPQGSTLISDVEDKSLLYHGTRADSAAIQSLSITSVIRPGRGLITTILVER